jgi:hypothetical protein
VVPRPRVRLGPPARENKTHPGLPECAPSLIISRSIGRSTRHPPGGSALAPHAPPRPLRSVLQHHAQRRQFVSDPV